MKSNLIQQTLEQLRSQRMLTILSIVGTALSIFLIMVVVMMQQVKVVPFAPESNRDRFMHVRYASIVEREQELYASNGCMSYKTAMEQIGSLSTPELVTIYTDGTWKFSAGLPGQPVTPAELRNTDDNFWKVFDFTFVSGKPYDKADFDAGLPVAVMCESTARRIFGTSDATGREFMLNYAPFRVCGIVKDVSSLAESSYAQIWIPASASSSMQDTWCGDLMGNFSATILARSTDDFDDIREEFERRVEDMNKKITDTGWKFITIGRPYTQEKDAVSKSSNLEPDLEGDRRSRMVVYLILLIVPAINLSGMTESRLRKRAAEIGVRRAFGCTRPKIFGQLLSENLLITAAAGIIGWVLSMVFAMLFSTELFTRGFSYTSVPPSIDISMLVQLSTFFTAIGFCFLLNLLSSGLPAWNASRGNIVNALNKKQ